MPAPFEIGDWVTDFSLRSPSGDEVKLSDTIGVPVVLLFLGGGTSGVCGAYHELAKRYNEFAALNTPIRAIQRHAALGSNKGDTTTQKDSTSARIPILIDADGSVCTCYGADGQVRAALLNPNARLTRYYELIEPAALVTEVLADVKAMIELESPRVIRQQAPVLLIPEVLPQGFCRHLMDVWTTQGSADSGVMKEIDGKTIGVFDYAHKIRRDHVSGSDTEIYKRVREFLIRRVVGEVAKCYNFEVTRVEDMKIACYDASRGGYFRPHRDNTTGGTAHRRFALSILLNDEYDGGYLRFPEYGPHLYRPNAGGALVFGCSLLHDVTDITAGQRFVLLTFFYGEKEALIRANYARNTGGPYRAGS